MASSEGSTVAGEVVVMVVGEVVATVASSLEPRSRHNRCQGCTALLCHTYPSTNRARHPGTRHCWPGQGTCLRTTSAVAGLLAWVEAVSEVAVMAAT